VRWGGVDSGEGAERASEEVKKLEELVSRIERVLDELKKAEFPSREELVERLTDVVKEIEDYINSLSRPSEVSELREVSNLLKTLGDVARDVLGSAISKFMEIVDGRKLGENISSLYTNLKNAGLPDQVIQEIIRDYTAKILSAVPNIADLVAKFLSMAQLKGGKELGKE